MHLVVTFENQNCKYFFEIKLSAILENSTKEEKKFFT